MTKVIANAAVAGLIAFSVSAQAQTPVLPPGLQATFFANIIGSADFTEENVLLGLQIIAAGSIPAFPEPTPFVSIYSSGDPIAAGDYLVLHFDGPEFDPDPETEADILARGTFDIYFFPENLPTGVSFSTDNLIFARLYDHVPVPGVPDGGSTLALLGVGLGCVAFIRRRK